MCTDLADQLQSLGIHSLVGNVDGLQSTDDSHVHIKNERRLLNVQKMT